MGKESDCFELSQLGTLTEIGGSLGIYNLENVQTKEEASESKLAQKNHIRELILEWDVMRPNVDPVKEENVLGSLVPHGNLQELCIRGHGGTNSPSWLYENLSVKCLESLCLDGVSWKTLPPLGEMWMVNELDEEYQGCSLSPLSFHNLRRLQLSNISRLKKWVGNGACPFFSYLEVLIIRGCSELLEFPFSHSTCYEARMEEKMGWFPRLREMVIVDCPKLASVPSIPWRTSTPCCAEIVRAGSGFEKLVYHKRYESKLSLEIEGKGGQYDGLWSGLNFSNLTDLEELYVNRVPPLPLDNLRVLASLKKIVIEGASSFLLSVGDATARHGVYRFPVEELRISNCDTKGKELTLLLSFLPNLSKLDMNRCENITGLGVVEHAETVSGEQQQQTRDDEEIITASAAGVLLLPPQLQELRISDCPKVSLLFSNPLHDNDQHATTEAGLQRLRSLSHLDVSGCPELLSSYSSLSSSVFPFPTCLQVLCLRSVKHMETLQALSNLTSLTELYLYAWEQGLRDEGLWTLLAHGRLTRLTLYTRSNFFAGSNPSWPHDKEGYSRSSKPLVLNTKYNTGVLAAPICSLLSSTLTVLFLLFGHEVECLTKEQEEALQLLTCL